MLEYKNVINFKQAYLMVSSSAPGSLCSSLNAGIIKDIYFSAGSNIEGHGT